MRLLLALLLALPAAAVTFTPNGAFDGNHIGIVWDDANGDVRFALADPHPQRITSGIVLGHGVPRIAFDGSIYFVTWVDLNSALVVQRISRDGDLIGSPLRVAEPVVWPNAPAITAIGSGAALVWEEPGYSLRGAIVSRDGSVATGGPIVTHQWEQRETQIAWNGQRYLILYRQFLSPILPHALGSSELRMIVLDAAGNPITAPAAVPIIDWQDVAGGPNGFVIAGRGAWDIRFLFVDNDGAVPRGIEYLWTYPRTPLYVGWTGTNFVTFFSPFAKRLDADGRIIDDDQRPPLIDAKTFAMSIVTTPDELFVLSFDGRTPELSLATPARIRAVRR